MAGPVGAHARKFSVAYLGLAAIFGAAIGLFIVLVERPAPPPPLPWSVWKPPSPDRTVETREIADHVAAQYHLPSGHRLVRVYVGGPGASSDPIRAVALATTVNPTAQSQIKGFVDVNQAVMYILCGTGAKCSIREGKASVARGTVLRREALELALYTFEYVKGTRSVLTFFPPTPGNSMTHGFFFERSDFGTQLHHPLRRTLPQRLPPRTDKLSPAERRVVDQLTTTRQFRFSLKRDQSGARVLVVAPPSG